MADIPLDAPITARKVEQILRDAGLPKAFARAIVAGGFKSAAGQDDTDAEAVAALAQRIQAAAERLKGLLRDER